MKWNFLYQITAASRTPDQGSAAPQIPVLSVLCPQLNMLNPPPEQNSWARHCTRVTRTMNIGLPALLALLGTITLRLLNVQLLSQLLTYSCGLSDTETYLINDGSSRISGNSWCEIRNFHTYEWLQPDMVTTCMPVVCSTFLSHFTPNFKCSPQHPHCVPVTVRYTTVNTIIFLTYTEAGKTLSYCTAWWKVS